MRIEDDDAIFSDDNSSANGLIVDPLTVDTTGDGVPNQTFAAGERIEPEYSFVVEDSNGYLYEVSLVQIGTRSDPRPVVWISKAYDPATSQFLDIRVPVGKELTAVDGSGSVFDDGDIDSGERFNRHDIYSNRPYGEYENIVCFADGTLITTTEGPRPVEHLDVGDLVLTMDNGFQPLRWIGNRRLDAQDTGLAARLNPIRIRKNAVAPGVPEADLLVSPQHRILLRSKIAQPMFGEPEILVAAHRLTELNGVEVAHDCSAVTYFHLSFARHEIVYANGAPAERFFLGPQTLKTLPEDAFAELAELFADIIMHGHETPMARLCPPKGKDIRKLIARHVKNQQHILLGTVAAP